MLQKNDTIGLVVSSNGLTGKMEGKIEKLTHELEELGLKVKKSPYLYAKDGAFSAVGEQRAKVLMDFYKDDEVKMIGDVSGGDLANEVLSYLDFEVIRKYPKPFFGYSDLTTIVNAIYAKTGEISYLYQIRNLIGDHSKEQMERFNASVLDKKDDLFNVHFDWLQGEHMSGVLVGGNIRCFLKLAGTPFMPELKGKILFLEAMSGRIPQMVTYLNQLRQIGAFEKVNGILLGTFTQMEQENEQPTIEELVKRVVNDKDMPIAKTREVGHGQDAKALKIGSLFALNK